MVVVYAGIWYRQVNIAVDLQTCRLYGGRWTHRFRSREFIDPSLLSRMAFVLVGWVARGGG